MTASALRTYVIACGCSPAAYEGVGGIVSNPARARTFFSRGDAELFRHKGVCNGGHRWRVVLLADAYASLKAKP